MFILHIFPYNTSTTDNVDQAQAILMVSIAESIYQLVRVFPFVDLFIKDNHPTLSFPMQQ